MSHCTKWGKNSRSACCPRVWNHKRGQSVSSLDTNTELGNAFWKKNASHCCYDITLVAKTWPKGTGSHDKPRPKTQEQRNKRRVKRKNKEKKKTRRRRRTVSGSAFIKFVELNMAMKPVTTHHILICFLHCTKMPKIEHSKTPRGCPWCTIFFDFLDTEQKKMWIQVIASYCPFALV